MQVLPLPRSQIAAQQISMVLTCLQISSWLLVIMQKGLGVGGGPAPSGKAHYNCLSRPHKSCISIICSKQPAIRSCKQGFWMQSQTIKMFHESIRERSSELTLWIHKTSFFLSLVSFKLFWGKKKERVKGERGVLDCVGGDFGVYLFVSNAWLIQGKLNYPYQPLVHFNVLLLAGSWSQHNGPGAKTPLLGGS